MAYTTIDNPVDFFNTKLYTGTGSSNSVTGVGFQPDMTWIKNRDQADEHNLYDAVRGATKRLIPNNSTVEGTQLNGLSAFGSDGFTVVDSNATNINTENYVAWNWKANGAGSANTNGSISSSVSVNTTAGFSIVKWTGSGANATIGHGLGTTPSMLIVKNTSGTGGWRVWSEKLGSTQSLLMDGANAAITSAGQFNSSATFNSTVFSVGGEGDTNESGSTIIAYCFAEKQGYSKFGSYTGNGNADGTFVYT